jgi:hypothetical protein
MGVRASGRDDAALMRERYAYTPPWARLLVEAVSFVMSRKILRGIEDRAEGIAAPLPAQADGRGLA